MITIKVGKKRLKVFNLIFLIFILCFLLYIIVSLFFMLPFFKSSYKYDINSNNYKINTKVTFKNKLFKCNVTEEIIISSSNNLIYEKLYSDLVNDGYKINNKGKGRRTIKYSDSCKLVKENYKKVHDDKYLTFTLNGNYNETISYGNEYVEAYVVSKINGKDVKDVSIVSNFNKNRLGKYLISYGLKIDDYYTKRLYRIIQVTDDSKPQINLIGDDVVILNYKEKYYENGFTATDNYDGDITKKVTIKNTVNSNKPGTYKVSYQVNDSSGNKAKVIRQVVVNQQEKKVIKEEPVIETKGGITYVNGVILVNKTYGLPKTYNPKVNNEAYNALKKMQADASTLGLDLSLVSGYRSYERQNTLYSDYVKKDGEEKANTYSAKPGHSEHQTGLAFDIGKVDSSFAGTDEALWIEENAHLYGFIVRYPKDKSDITGYIYEPWHVRYLGIDTATKVKQSGLCLEEYLGISY